MSAETSPRRIHLLSGLIVLGTFLAGGAAGAGLHASFATRHHQAMHVGGGPGPFPHRGPPPHLRELELTAEQQQQAEALFEAHRTQVEAVMKDSFPKVRELNEQLHVKLKALLTPEQVTKLEVIEARRAQRRGPGPGGPGGPGPGGPGAPGGPPPLPPLP